MSRQRRRTRPGDAANIFIRAVLSEASALLGGFTEDEWTRTLDYFGGRCAYTGEPLIDGQIDQDHAVPMNMQSVGLHLFGNVLPVTKEANKRKHARPWTEFVTDPERRALVQAFILDSGYENRVASLGDLTNYCRSRYEEINGLVAASRSYLSGLLPPRPAAEAPTIIDAMEPAGPVSVRPASTRPGTTLPISLSPSDSREFKQQFLRTKLAWITRHYADGRVETSPWRAEHFSSSSNVIGNLRTRAEFRQGEWQRRGLVQVSVSIKQPVPEKPSAK